MFLTFILIIISYLIIYFFDLLYLLLFHFFTLSFSTFIPVWYFCHPFL